MIDAQELQQALDTRFRNVAPPCFVVEGELIPILMETIYSSDVLEEVLEFLCRQYLDDKQDDILLESREKWPPSDSGEIAVPGVDIDVEKEVVHMSFKTSSGPALVLEPLYFHEFLRPSAPAERVWQLYADPRKLERVWGRPRGRQPSSTTTSPPAGGTPTA